MDTSDQSHESAALLLIEHNSTKRKLLRRCLENDGHAVLALNSLGEALTRLRLRRLRHYDLVLCPIPPHSRSRLYDYGLLVEESGLVRRAAGYDLYLPALGINATAVLIYPSDEPWRVRKMVREVRAAALIGSGARDRERTSG